MHRRFAHAALAATTALAVAACSSTPIASTLHPSAQATLKPTAGNAVKGEVVFNQRGSNVDMHAKVSGLTPNAEHGFHIHEKGDCSAPDGSSAGGHWNPRNMPHGAAGAPGGAHHAGDLPSLKADAQGNADVKATLAGLSVTPGDFSVVGKGLIVHANPDDFQTQPTGNSGPRTACAVIIVPAP